jgi:hypothetical protein
MELTPQLKSGRFPQVDEMAKKEFRFSERQGAYSIVHFVVGHC